MKFAPVLAVALLASPALADHHDVRDGHSEHTEHAKAEAKAGKFSTDTPIEILMENAKAKAVLAKHMGGQDVSQHPMYPQFKAMSLKAVAPFSQGMITEDMLAKIAADLAEIK